MNANVQQKDLLNFTDIASAKVKDLLTENGDARLRIFVTGLGCSGAEFGFAFDRAETADDVALEVSGVPLIVDSLSYPYLAGAEIDYAHRKLRWKRQDFRTAKRALDQNLFLRGGRVFVRGSIDGNGFYQFLLDTGSEPTLLTTAGLAHANLPPSSKVSPKRVYGLGKTQVEWGRLAEVTLGLSGFGVRFEDIAVKDDENAFEDGIVGTSLLEHFRVGIDFSRMVLSLEKEH